MQPSSPKSAVVTMSAAQDPQSPSTRRPDTLVHISCLTETRLHRPDQPPPYRTELQPSGGIHGDELDTSIATAALKLTESRVNQLLTLTADAPSL
jgi:hypothetical protein